jgi:Mrp family chromosome partitioning ATPase
MMLLMVQILVLHNLAASVICGSIVDENLKSEFKYTRQMELSSDLPTFINHRNAIQWNEDMIMKDQKQVEFGDITEELEARFTKRDDCHQKILIMSGMCGVGKSFVSQNLAL